MYRLDDQQILMGRRKHLCHLYTCKLGYFKRLCYCCSQNVEESQLDQFVLDFFLFDIILFCQLIEMFIFHIKFCLFFNSVYTKQFLYFQIRKNATHYNSLSMKSFNVLALENSMMKRFKFILSHSVEQNMRNIKENICVLRTDRQGKCNMK